MGLGLGSEVKVGLYLIALVDESVTVVVLAIAAISPQHAVVEGLAASHLQWGVG